MKWYIKYIYNSLCFYKIRNIIVILIVSLGAFSYFASENIVLGFNEKLEDTNKILGTDLIIAPSNVDNEVEKSLFSGKPTTVYFSNNEIASLNSVESIDVVEKELLIATIDADCCDSKLQAIAFDIKNDFAIYPWLANDIQSLSSNEIIVGSRVSYRIGDTAHFFGKHYKVVGKLLSTNMGYDTSIFVSMDEGYRLLNRKNIFSVALIKLKDNADVSKEMHKINLILKRTKMTAYKNDAFYVHLKKEIFEFSKYARMFNTIIILIVTSSVFSISTFNLISRKKEIISFELLGYNRNDWLKIYACENVVITIIGIVISIIIYSMGSIFLRGIFENSTLYSKLQLQSLLCSSCKTCLLFLITSMIGIIISFFRYEKSDFALRKEGL